MTKTFLFVIAALTLNCTAAIAANGNWLEGFLNSNKNCGLDVRGGFSVKAAQLAVQKNDALWDEYVTLAQAYNNSTTVSYTGILETIPEGKALAEFLDTKVAPFLLKQDGVFFRERLTGEIGPRSNKIVPLKVKMKGKTTTGFLTGSINPSTSIAPGYQEMSGIRILVDGHYYQVLHMTITSNRYPMVKLNDGSYGDDFLAKHKITLNAEDKLANAVGYRDGDAAASWTEVNAPSILNAFNLFNGIDNSEYLVYDADQDLFRRMTREEYNQGETPMLYTKLVLR